MFLGKTRNFFVHSSILGKCSFHFISLSRSGYLGILQKWLPTLHLLGTFRTLVGIDSSCPTPLIPTLILYQFKQSPQLETHKREAVRSSRFGQRCGLTFSIGYMSRPQGVTQSTLALFWCWEILAGECNFYFYCHIPNSLKLLQREGYMPLFWV